VICPFNEVGDGPAADGGHERAGNGNAPALS
jgi:hypothetical protein